MGDGKILLLAKDWKTRVLANAQLLEEGFDVTALADPSQARAQLLAGETPDLVIVDEAGWDEGSEAAGWIHALRPDLPMLLLEHAWQQAPSAARVEEAPGPGQENLHHLSRPFSIGDLVDAARRLLRA